MKSFIRINCNCCSFLGVKYELLKTLIIFKDFLNHIVGGRLNQTRLDISTFYDVHISTKTKPYQIQQNYLKEKNVYDL